MPSPTSSVSAAGRPTPPTACSPRSRARPNRWPTSYDGYAPMRRPSPTCGRSPPRRSPRSAAPASRSGSRAPVPAAPWSRPTSQPARTACDDLTTPGNRRHRHPFVSCTNCGPRFTIVKALPYDRPSTTMAGFAMCPACAAEYADPADRRFHAQPIACPACGPTLALDQPGAARREGEDALAEAKRMLADGAVLAVKGLGGYHLACEASDASAVGLLRKRKQRGDKPFAVMVADADAADLVVATTQAERDLLTGHHRPIVLLPRRDGSAAAVCAEVAPGNPDLGVMTAVHPPAPPAARPTGPGARDDQRQRCRRTDRHRRRRSPRAAGRPGRRLAHPRPADPCALRRLGGTRGRRRAAAGPPLPGLRAAPAAPAVPDRAGARRRRRPQEHLLSRRRPPGLDVGPRRRHGRLPHPAGVRPPPSSTSSRSPASRPRRWSPTAPVVPLRRLGPHPRRRPPGPPRCSTTTPTSRRRWPSNGHPGDRPVLGFAFDGTGYGDRRRGLGRRVPARRLRRRSSRAHLGYVPLPGGDAGVRNPCRMALSHLARGRHRVATRLPSVPPPARDERRSSPASSRPGWPAPPRPAWAGSSTPSRRWPASATASSTRRRPRSTWRPPPGGPSTHRAATRSRCPDDLGAGLLRARGPRGRGRRHSRGLARPRRRPLPPGRRRSRRRRRRRVPASASRSARSRSPAASSSTRS